VSWPDIAIVGVVLIGALRGTKRGFVGELGGIVALAVGLYAAVHYPGIWDEPLHGAFNLSIDSAHAVGTVLFGLGFYAAVSAVALLLSGVAKLPIVGTANAVLGGVIGMAKGALLVWAILYAVLFTPLSHDVRSDLHHSKLVVLITQPNANVDGAVKSNLPWFVKPFAQPLFDRHRV